MHTPCTPQPDSPVRRGFAGTDTQRRDRMPPRNPGPSKPIDNPRAPAVADLTSEVLYRLSYVGVAANGSA
jgi:hypothetical protein